jgi:hypothetical protein
VSNPSFLNSQTVGLSRCHPAAHPPRIEAVASISFVKTEDYNRCCVHHVRLHRRRCPACCLCRGYPNICRSLPSIFSTIPLATSASASGNNFGLHSKRSYVVYCHRGIAADNELHCRRRQCFRSTSRSHVISTVIKRFSATLALGQQNSPVFVSSAKSLIRTAQPGTRPKQVNK